MDRECKVSQSYPLSNRTHANLEFVGAGSSVTVGLETQLDDGVDSVLLT